MIILTSIGENSFEFHQIYPCASQENNKDKIF